MQITTPTGTYKWIGKYWGEKNITDFGKISVTYGEVGFTDKYQGVLRTYHTPEQLVKLGYMELIETKPEEKPTYWYIETSEMKKSEYWSIFRDFYAQEADLLFNLKFYGMNEEEGYSGKNKIETEYIISPQQWYDTIYDGEKPTEHGVNCEHCIEQSPHTAIDHYKCKCGNGLTFYGGRGGSGSMCEKCGYDSQNVDQPDHDKAMEIEEVPEYKSPWKDSQDQMQLERLTNSLNLIIKKINNL